MPGGSRVAGQRLVGMAIGLTAIARERQIRESFCLQQEKRPFKANLSSKIEFMPKHPG
ncbi:hypothetical protein MTY_0358 [Moorella thermoacetica Y72]|uniref:Uncharacterized protein n=1 Tax=Moorella thermoacetica Y72 TaxID=1325331 RepID=A0A0S6U8L5_NEOTH|nr:hypothetical protein MTY_0358 [Moorella thermoacetica Y72]